MKVSKYSNGNHFKTEYGIINNRCSFCRGYSIIDDMCIDCYTKREDIIYYSRRDVKEKLHILKMEFELSDKQKEASLFFLNKLKKHENGFLNSVCGSGKTEIMYEPILYALNNKMKVAIVIPRKEIVKELYERLEQIFPNTIIKFIDGLNHDDECDLLLSTCNQMINYEDEFDLIILDEADAFPYSDSDYLKRIVKKSLKIKSSIFYMSATIKNRINADKFIISRRYHGTDLSMPIFVKYNNDDITKNSHFQEIINKGNRKFIIYFDSIKKAYDYSNKMGVEYVSSKTKNSREIIDNFKRNSDRILVSTTILERGITIKNLDVIIVDAESKIFNHQTIIQICGRVGRSKDDNKGNIYIFYKKNSIKFYLVKRYIRKMNEM